MPRGNRVLSVPQTVKYAFLVLFLWPFEQPPELSIPSLTPLREGPQVSNASTASKSQPGIWHSELLWAPVTLLKAEFWSLPRIRRKLRLGRSLSHTLREGEGREGGSSLCFESLCSAQDLESTGVAGLPSLGVPPSVMVRRAPRSTFWKHGQLLAGEEEKDFRSECTLLPDLPLRELGQHAVFLSLQRSCWVCCSFCGCRPKGGPTEPALKLLFLWQACKQAKICCLWCRLSEISSLCLPLSPSVVPPPTPTPSPQCSVW